MENSLDKGPRVTKSPVRNTASGLIRLMCSICMAEEEWLSEFVHVDVAELGDAHAVKGGRKSGQIDVVLCYLDPVPLDLARIKRQTSSAVQACREEAAAAEESLGGGERKSHALSMLTSPRAGLAQHHADLLGTVCIVSVGGIGLWLSAGRHG